MPISLSLNYSGIMEDVIGAHGITRGELQDALPALAAARVTLLERFQAGDLEWMRLPMTRQYLEPVQQYWAQNRRRFDAIVVLGIGGSALGNIALQTALRPPFWNELAAADRNGARLYVLDNVDPERPSMLLKSLDIEKTVFNVISKSGSTAETLAQMLVVLPFLRDRLGERWKEQVVVTTDPEKGLMRRLVREFGLASFPVPAGVGGRFSVLSPVGLFSAVGTGIDGAALLEGASEMHRHFETARPEVCLPLLLAGLPHLAHTRHAKHIHVMMPYSDRLKDMADWYRQLWAESLGKSLDRKGRRVQVGPTPVKALGVTDQHSQMQLYMEGPFDKVLILLETAAPACDLRMGAQPLEEPAVAYLAGHSLWELMQAELHGTKIALLKAGRPSIALRLPKVAEGALGELICAWELATAVAGELYDINAFDQPGVEASKIATYALMGRTEFEETRKEIAALESKLARYAAP